MAAATEVRKIFVFFSFFFLFSKKKKSKSLTFFSPLSLFLFTPNSIPGGLTIPAFKDLMRDVFDLPSVLAYPLFTRLVPAGSGGTAVPEPALRRWVEAHGGLAASPETRMFDILRGESGGGGGKSGNGGEEEEEGAREALTSPSSSLPSSPSAASPSSSSSDVVTADGLKALLAGVLLSHPGLEFLQDAPEFQDRYAETVIHR